MATRIAETLKWPEKLPFKFITWVSTVGLFHLLMFSWIIIQKTKFLYLEIAKAKSEFQMMTGEGVCAQFVIQHKSVA